MLLTGCSFPQAHLALGINHKAIEDMFSRIAAARQAYVVEKQKSIVFGHEKSWAEVEADEATFQRTNVSKDVEYKDSAQEGKPILCEQWSGIMVRGKPTTLLLSRLAPPLTKSRAPGAGAIRKEKMKEKQLEERLFKKDDEIAAEMEPWPGVGCSIS
eukprot:symbB.v1.2.031137.t1/scaffold3581.1/size55290/6